ncbi:MAG: glycosyltransferase family 9 protein [Bacteroidota bacterium]
MAILLIQTAFIGDVILATPLIEVLHEKLPDQPIDFLLRKGNEGLVVGHPKLRKVWIWDKKQDKYKNLRRLSKEVRKVSYSHVINLQRFGATGLLTLFSGAKNRIGFSKNPFSAFYSHRFPHILKEGTHEVERNLNLLQPVIGEVSEPILPKLYPSPSDWEKVKLYKKSPYICMAPSSVWFTKQFPSHKWIELIAKIPEALQVMLLGGPGDKNLCDEIIQNTTRDKIFNLAGELSLLQSTALMADAEMNYVNDSAPLHMASASNAPTTAIFCSTHPKFGFGPLSDQSLIIQHPNPPTCRPCGLHGFSACPQKHFQCAEGIDTSEIPIPLP